ncbi:polysaccharide lyase family protein [Asticcacaulis sp. EMRT-3]|uniref:polysaccharide lyase family protein n=1 Tax=Asticcacaulis sp. EMRT-3 TaxID=3040349 RepID=UPI0024AE8929|nr:polysaccharide lyase family protein [Asticcacaulis sp. EMRT-3]MDI7775953.1 polysaccharide lyase family protein [Asticcacaulis sp. EMRT-3]
MKPFRALILLAAAALCAGIPLTGWADDGHAVTVTDNGNSWTLDNGIVRATIAKDTGYMPSLIYHGKELMSANKGGSWEHTPEGAPHVTNSITIDPASNGGERAEVSVKGVTDGVYTLSPHAPGGGAQADMEIRYALGKGDSGIYVYAIWDHPASYPAGGTGPEDRFITRLSHDFDWITVDKDRNMLEASPKDWGAGVVVHAKEQRIMSTGVYKNSVEHKYSYSGMQYRQPAYGWSSTKDHIGIWFINPTTEYLSGGPTRIDLDAHFDSDNDPDPIILDYWHSGHYLGASTPLKAGEAWRKVIGPIFVYVNALDHPAPTTAAELKTLAETAGNPTVPASWTKNADALYANALAEAKTQNAEWPYGWVKAPGYTPADQRGTVTGHIVLDDPLAPAGTPKTLPDLVVGLTQQDDDAATPPQPPANMPARYAARYAEQYKTLHTGPDAWRHDARFYQFFNDGKADGSFAITKVRPGTYTLHAWADGVLGEYSQANITVEPGKTLDLGKIDWQPVRHGRQLWQIGYPNQSASEFFKGDQAWLWGWNLRYALLFPHDLTYTIGKSTPAKDWFFEEVPHATDLSFVNPAAKDPANQTFGWVKTESLDQYPQTDHTGPWRIYGNGRATTWTVRFNLPQDEHGTAYLRVALAGEDGMDGQLPVAVNDQSIGAIGDGSSPDNARMLQTNAIRYNTDRGLWQQRTLSFDAARLKKGWNTMSFTVPAGSLQSGVVWDYLRLELADAPSQP